MNESDQSIQPIEVAFDTAPVDRHDDRWTRRWGRKSPWVIAAFALAVRLIYFIVVSQPPVIFDARRYTAAGLALPLALENPSLITDSLARASIDFKLLFTDQIKDEGVVWIESHPPSFPGSLDDVYFAGPIYPLFVGTVISLAPRYDFWGIRILQAIIDSLTAALLWIVVRRLVSSAAAWWAGGLWALYGPAICMCGQILTETLSIAFGVLIVWFMIRAFDSGKRRWLIASGVMCAILALTKAATLALIVALAIGWIIANRRRLKTAVGGSIWLGLSFAVLMAPWILIVYFRFGTLATRDPAYAGANLRSSNILYGEGYDLDWAPNDFWTYPVWREIKSHPFAYAHLYVLKFYRMWSRSSDDYRRGFPLGIEGVLWMHRVIVLLALFGLFVWYARAGPIAAIPLLFVGYFVALHMVFHVVSRYNLPAMPMVIGAAALGSGWILQGARALRWRSVAITAAAFVAAFGGILLLRPAFWLMLKPLFGWQSATWAFWISGTATVIGATWFLTSKPRRPWRWLVRIGSALVLAILFLTQAIPREGHADWSVDLRAPDERVERTITFPSWLVADSICEAFIDVDGVSEERKDCEVTLSVDGITRTLTTDSLSDERFFYPKYSYVAFMDLYKHRRADLRHWVINPMDSVEVDSLLSDHRVTIGLSARPIEPDPGGLIVYGDLPVADYRQWIGPMFERSSVERYYEGGDPRLWGNQPLDFVAATSRYIDGERVSTDDLSDRWGRQAGQYRVFVTILTPSGEYRSF